VPTVRRALNRAERTLGAAPRNSLGRCSGPGAGLTATLKPPCPPVPWGSWYSLVACMDARLNVYAILGLADGEAGVG